MLVACSNRMGFLRCFYKLATLFGALMHFYSNRWLYFVEVSTKKIKNFIFWYKSNNNSCAQSKLNLNLRFDFMSCVCILNVFFYACVCFWFSFSWKFIFPSIVCAVLSSCLVLTFVVGLFLVLLYSFSLPVRTLYK